MAKLKKTTDVKQYSNPYTGGNISQSAGVGGMNSDIPPIDNFGGQLGEQGGNAGHPNFSFNSQTLGASKNRPKSANVPAKKVVKKK